jgi:hypothetical protein
MPSQDRPAGPDHGLDRIYDVAERLATTVAERAPDWCAIRRDALELAARAEPRCQQST